MTHILDHVAPKGKRAILDAIKPVYHSTLAEFGIDTPLRIAHFTAQIAHESDGFRTTEEYASGAAYEGRKDLGNTQPGDGRLFKGVGFIQTTGRSNHTAAAKHFGMTLEGFRRRCAEDPAFALEVACWEWNRRDLSQHADRDDIRAITKRINGGYNGLADRKRYLAIAKAHAGDEDKPKPSSWWTWFAWDKWF